MKDKIEEGFGNIIGLPLTKTTRSELTQFFHFGKTHYTTPQGLVLDVGAYTLAVNCPWQLLQPLGETIKHDEVFIRKQETGLPSTKFDWKEPGANLRDQRLKELISRNTLLAESIALQEKEGFIFHFANGAQLSVKPDSAKPTDTYWQLFSNQGDGFKLEATTAGVH